MAPLPPLTIGVCSWSLKVRSIKELKDCLDKLKLDVVQIACGDPHHAAWEEGDQMPAAAKAAGFRMAGAMLGFPGEDYTSPAIIAQTGGFGNPATRAERLERFTWAVQRTKELGLNDLMFHAGFIPDPMSPDRRGFLDTLGKAAALAWDHHITLALETGQETAAQLRRLLDDLQCPNVKINFDPANMLLYDMDDPLGAAKMLAPDIRSVHAKDAIRPTTKGEWGTEMPLGQGHVDIPRWVRLLHEHGYTGPLFIEREGVDQTQALKDIAHGIRVLKKSVAQAEMDR